MPFTFKETPISGLLIIIPHVFSDVRGFFTETYKQSDFARAGIHETFVQDNHSKSSRGTLRGLHFQREPHAQGKLVRVTKGSIWDVAIDLRADSTTYAQWFGLELSENNKVMFYIPAGFAHGFVALEDDTELQYKCTAEYNAASDGGIRWNDPRLAIQWPIKEVLISPKDASLPFLDIESSRL